MIRTTFSRTFRKDDEREGFQQTELDSVDDVEQQLSVYDDKMARAIQRYKENYQKKSVPRTLYYTDDNDNLVNRVEEHLINQKMREEKIKESCIVKNWNKIKLIENHRHKRQKHAYSSSHERKVNLEVKFGNVQEKVNKMNKDFEKFRKQKLKSYQDKQRSIEEQKSNM